MNSPAKDIKDILVANGSLGLVYATNIFTNKEPALPKNCVTIFNTNGFAPDLGLDSQGYERPSIQIRVRNTSESNAWSLIENIKSKLHGLHQETWNGTLYTVIYCSSGPALLDWDDNGNCRLVCNFNIQRHAV